MKNVAYVVLVVSLWIAGPVAAQGGRLAQDDIVIDPGGGKVKLTTSGGREGAGDSMTLRDDVMNLDYHLCASSAAGSEEAREVVIVTDRWHKNPRVVLLRQEGERVRIYVNGVALLGETYVCDHTTGDCKNTGLPEELSGEVETGKFYWINSSGELKSDKTTRIELVYTERKTGC